MKKSFWLIILFISKASGPDFEKNVTMKPFSNIHVYSLICDLLKITCNPNNGSSEVFKSQTMYLEDNKSNTIYKTTFLSYISFLIQAIFIHYISSKN